MTSVQWLEQIVKSMVINGGDLGEDYPALMVHIEQAKELEKQQIIDSFNEGQEYEYQYHINNAPKFDSQTYYAETYGSKGSELEQIDQTNPVTKGSTALVKTTSEKWKEYQDWLNEVPEISDEEIEKGAKEWYEKEGPYKPSVISIKTWGYAIKWYREQLKKK